MHAPRHVRIIDPVLSAHTGFLLGGVAEFIDGVSVEPLRWDRVNELAAIVACEDATTGASVGVLANADADRARPADAPEIVAANYAHEHDGTTRSAAQHYTRAELEAVADRDGLPGVREIARAWSRTGRSIVECIEAVLGAQAAHR